MPTIRYVSGGWEAEGQQALGEILQAFRVAMLRYGWEEGQGAHRYVLEPSYAEGNIDNFQHLMIDDVPNTVDILLALDSRAFWPVVIPPGKQAIGQGPFIVAAITSAPVTYNMVHDLNRPGTRITGVYVPARELTWTRFRLMKEAFNRVNRQLRRVAVLRYVGHRRSDARAQEEQAAHDAAHAFDVEIVRFIDLVKDDGAAEIAAKIRPGLANPVEAMVTIPDAIMNYFADVIVGTVNGVGKPAIYGPIWFSENGGLMSYGPNPYTMMAQAADYVALLLDGHTDPTVMPMQTPRRYDWACNPNLAEQQGVGCPDEPYAGAINGP